MTSKNTNFEEEFSKSLTQEEKDLLQPIIWETKVDLDMMVRKDLRVIKVTKDQKVIRVIRGRKGQEVSKVTREIKVTPDLKVQKVTLDQEDYLVLILRYMVELT